MPAAEGTTAAEVGRAQAATGDTVTVELPGLPGPVRLLAGRASFAVAPGSAARGRVRRLPELTARWHGDGRTDVATVLVAETGGSGTFYHLVLLDSTGGALAQRAGAFLGDRIAVTRIGIGELVHDPEADYRITVQTLVRRDGEPMAAPATVPRTRTFYVTGQRLEAVEPGRDDN